MSVPSLTRDRALGERLVEWRRQRFIPQADLARLLSMPKTTLCTWEKRGVPYNDAERLRLSMREIQRGLQPTVVF